MASIRFQPQHVCAREMEIEYDDNLIITKVTIVGGCQGNTQGVARLLVGNTIKEAVEKLEGIRCRGSRTGDTSCPDQLAQGLKQLLK